MRTFVPPPPRNEKKEEEQVNATQRTSIHGGEGSPLGCDAHRISQKRRINVFMSIAFFAIGFAPITTLAFAIIGVLPLGAGALLLVLPAAVVGIGLGMKFRGMATSPSKAC
jgi:hypothetical protein